MIKPRKGKYDSTRLRETGALYQIAIGVRSNGKTYDALIHSIDRYVEARKRGKLSQTVYLRRMAEDITGARGDKLCTGLTCNADGVNVIRQLTGGEWDRVVYRSRSWTLARYDEETQTVVKDRDPFLYGLSLSGWEHDKSTAYPHVDEIVFDEFLASSSLGYLVDEFVIFCNVLSTIIRDRDDVVVRMLGNTINPYCPYFAEMRLTDIKKQEPGTIKVYEYADTGLRVAVEYCTPDEAYKRSHRGSDVYFSFDNPKLSMITTGAWQLAMYPHLPHKYKRSDIIAEYYIIFDRETYHGEVIVDDTGVWSYIHRKTTPIDEDRDDVLIYTQDYDPRPNYRRRITRGMTKAERRLGDLFVQDKVFYQDNSVGAAIENYIKWCQTA